MVEIGLDKVVKNVSLSFTLARKDIESLRLRVSELTGALNQVAEAQKSMAARLASYENSGKSKSSIILAPRISARRPAFFLGAASTMKVHEPSCPFAKNVLKSNKVVFRSKSQAFRKGYRPCQCLL